MTPEERARETIEREDIYALVKRERFARDQRLFDEMRACFEDDAYVRTSWYDGTGGEAYVEATRALMGASDFSKHWVFPALARIEGDRATVESPALIFNRVMVGEGLADIEVNCRFFSRVVRRGGVWRLGSFVVLWERDVMRPVPPSSALDIDWDLLATFRPSYRFLAYMQNARGVKVNHDLLGDDRWDALTAFHRAEARWLGGG